MMEIFVFVVLVQRHNLVVNLHLRLRTMSLPRPNAGADSAHAAIFARDVVQRIAAEEGRKRQLCGKILSLVFRMQRF